jgi:hypothetical protein
VLTPSRYAVHAARKNAQHKVEVKEMTKFSFWLGRYFLLFR